MSWVASMVLGVNVLGWLVNGRQISSRSWGALVAVCWLWFLYRRLLRLFRLVRRGLWALRFRRALGRGLQGWPV